jgi:hypothetical protein
MKDNVNVQANFGAAGTALMLNAEIINSVPH